MEHSNKNMPHKYSDHEDEIDLVALAKTLWEGRKKIIQTTDDLLLTPYGDLVPGQIGDTYENKEEYIDIVEKIIFDKEFKKIIRKKIKQNENLLYKNKNAILALENFFQNIKDVK